MSTNKIYTLLAEAEDQNFERLQEIVTLIAEIAGVNNSSFEEAAASLSDFVTYEEEPAEDEPEETTQTVVVLKKEEGDPRDEDDHRDRLDGSGDLLVRRAEDGLWIWPDFSKYGTTLKDADTCEGPLTFAPQPEGADPLDENDHRPRLTSGGAELTRRDCGTWHNFGSGSTCPNPSADPARHQNNMSLLTWNESDNGPLTFAD